MKDLGKKLILNKTTIDILDDNKLENVKGGIVRRGPITCGMISVPCHSCYHDPPDVPASIAL